MNRPCLVALLVLASACTAAQSPPLPGIARQAATLEQSSLELVLTGADAQALALAEQALVLYRRIDATGSIVGALNRIGELRLAGGARAGAELAFREADELARQTSDRVGEAAAANNRGALARERGDRMRARTFFLRALALSEEADAPATEASAANNLALLEFEAGRWREAAALLDRALGLDRAAGDTAGEALRLYNLAAVEQALGKESHAVEYLEEAHGIDRAREDVPAIARDLAALAVARVAAGGDLRRAINERHRAVSIWRLLQDTSAAEQGRAAILLWCTELAADPAPLDCIIARAQESATRGAGNTVE
ncbi:MAG: tetratricopeptide repeat protein [Deltaproteobacteria bacterium]